MLEFTAFDTFATYTYDDIAFEPAQGSSQLFSNEALGIYGEEWNPGNLGGIETGRTSP